VRNITLSDVTISAQTAPYGGGFGLFGATGNILIEDSFFNGNTSTSSNPGDGGGGVDLDNVGGSVTVVNSAFYGNTSANPGGGLRIRDDGFTGSVIVRNSTFTSNSASGPGGGFLVEKVEAPESVLIDSSTFSGNSIGDGATGVSVSAPDIVGRVDIINSTFDESGLGAFPIAGFVDGGVLDIRYSTIIGADGAVTVEAVTGPDGAAAITSSILSGGATPAVVVDGVGSVNVSYSILSSADDMDVADAGGNQFSVADPKLGSLQDNGGPTFTRLPLVGSPAIDKGLPGGTPPAFDQRGTGFARVVAGRVDVGAVESSLSLAATGQTINIWIPIAAGVLILGGAAAIILNVVRRRRLR
jgi:hypothetical protein